jgi:polyketide synthase PksN
VIKGLRILPGVAYLEMARAAVRVALGANALHEPGHLHLSHIVWVHPLAVGEQPVTAQITLSPQESGTLAFLISPAGVPYTREGSDPQEEESNELVYCQGMALVGQAHKLQEDADGSTESQRLDLPALQARCPHPISARECYQRYRELSLTYGPAFQALEHLSVGEGEVLARFCLPSVVAQTQTEFVLHPSILDAALHASIGLLIRQNTQMPLHVPFALSDLSIEGPVPIQGWTWIRRSSQSMGTPFSTLVLDVDVCDDAGRVAVRLRGLSVRPFPGKKRLLWGKPYPAVPMIQPPISPRRWPP